MTAATVISEAGWDMTKWRSEGHFVSWLRLCPDNQISGDKIIGKGRLPRWCAYFRVGNSNRIVHQIDWAVQSELQLWLRRKHQCSWRSARKHWNYQFLYKRCRLYQMVGRVSHLPGLRRMPPDEDGRRAGCGKSARPVR